VRVCIYCLIKKPEDAFNREHVIPEAFGTFQGNLVLDCVCQDCNQHFGDTIDLKFARDSIEGIDRFWSGMKSPAEFKSFGHKSTTKVKFKDGAIQGGTGYAAANLEGQELKVFAFPQIGLQQPPGPILWFLPDDLPRKSALPELGFDVKQGCFVHVREMSIEQATEALAKVGFNKLESWQTTMSDPGEVVETEMVGIIGRPEMRVATKIAMNYLASVAGPAILRTASFDEVRNFARHDFGSSRVHVSENPWTFGFSSSQPIRGHYLAAQTMSSGRIVAQVSVHLRIRYVVHLMNTDLLTGNWAVSSCHFFDIDRKAVTRLRRVPPLVPGKQLQVVASST
jgi:HNH endonuclease